MLRVNVGMSRKLTKDFQSTGFSVNLDGEICVPLDDPETLIEKIREYYDLCDETLRDQIERHESELAIAGRDEEPSQDSGRSAKPQPQENFNDRRNEQSNPNHRNGNGNGTSNNSPPATNKQLNYLLMLGKRQGMSKPQLENRIAGLLGQQVDVYNLSKQEAGIVLDDLSGKTNPRSPQN